MRGEKNQIMESNTINWIVAKNPDGTEWQLTTKFNVENNLWSEKDTDGNDFKIIAESIKLSHGEAIILYNQILNQLCYN